MNGIQHPTIAKLLTIWIFLIGATVITMVAGKVTQLSTIGPIWVGILLFVTWIKANLIVSYFLNLRAATGSWQQIFNVLMGAIVVVIFILYLAS